MSAAAEKPADKHVPPDGSAWLEAQRSVAERNDQTCKAARQARDEQERELAARRVARERGRVAR